MCFIRNLRRKLQRISKSQKKDSFNINHISKSRALFTKSESVKKVVLNFRQKTTLTSIMDEVKSVSSVLTSDITPTNIVLYLEKLKYNTKQNLFRWSYNFAICCKKEVNKHFQQIAGSTNQEKILSGIWIDQYSPRDYIYDGLMDHITQEEIMYHIFLLPNGKASGPSRVSYEMIKHSSSEMKTYIKDYLNECLTLKKIPKEWKIADLYPIPKPKPWACRLVNTRPIVLLETMRKLLVSILNRRCSKIFKGNNVLRGNQFAGLEGNSTFEPVRIIKEIIQDAIENKKELWILALDMAKAYDRVNIHMLKKAMNRNRPGEIISPLLWCIYYDPLLCQLQQESYGYEITAKYKKDIYSDYIKESIIFPGKVYMDDTTLVSKDQLQLETIFGGSEYINIKPKDPNESIRILGVWFNVNDDKKFVLNQAKSEVKTSSTGGEIKL
ncbi:unnamed protein product [Rhizophagus irregularis]|nr:unnamed protein product [Rhizophagus irregularis]